MFIYKSKDFNLNSSTDRILDQIFVWQSGNIYIMDNHRSALWAWFNEIKNNANINLKILHIDTHLDMSPRGLHCKCASSVNFEKLDLNNYLAAKHNCEQYGNIKIFSYENFLRFFVQELPLNIKATDVFVTNPHWKIKPSIDPAIIQIIESYRKDFRVGSDCSQTAQRLYKVDLINTLKNDDSSTWIVDLDLDYFYNEEKNELNIELANEIIAYIKEWYDKNKIAVLTVAWSPEFLINKNLETADIGLKRAKKINLMLSTIFNLDFPEI